MSWVESVGAKRETGQWFLSASKDDYESILQKAKEEGARLITISGHDEEELGVTYHLDINNEVLNLSVPVGTKRPSIKTIIHIFPGADLYERELQEMFGIRVTGRVMKPLFLSKELEGKNPLRKSFKTK